MKNKNKINVALCSDNTYFIQLCVALSSLLKSANCNTVYEVNILLSNGISEENMSLLKFIQALYTRHTINTINCQNEYKGLECTIAHITVPTYYRLLLPSLLPNVKKCIYLDCDVIVKKDLSDLYSIDIEGYYVAGVRAAGYFYPESSAKSTCDCLGISSISNYINAGVMLLNLDLLRKDNVEPIFKELAFKKYPSQDQDVINKVCFSKTKILAPKFNAMTKYKLESPDFYFTRNCLQNAYGLELWTEARLHPYIIHYADKIKPWNDLNSDSSADWWSSAAEIGISKETFTCLNNNQLQSCLLRSSYFSSIRMYHHTLKQLLKDIYSSFNNEDIVIWGTGSFGLKVLELLIDFNLCNNVKAFCSTYQDKNNKILGIQVLIAEEAIKKYPNARFIIASEYVSDILSSELYKNSDIKIYLPNVSNILKNAESRLFNFSKNLNDFSYCCFNISWFDTFSESSDYLKHVQNILPLLEDDLSKCILTNRIFFFRSGDTYYLKKIKVDIETFFCNEYLPISDNEVYFDCGAYDGDTIKSFIDYTKNKYSKIVAFEPMESAFRLLKNYVKSQSKNSNIVIHNYGCGDKNENISFINLNSVGSLILNKNEIKESDVNKVEKIKNIKLDNYIKENPTFIKMDIEGYELNALKGAENILRSLKPKLAICIYHKQMDFYYIIKYLKSIVPEYHFKIRTHYDSILDTVLYAYTTDHINR